METGQTASGKRVIFAWFEGKKALVGWYHSEVHQKAMKTGSRFIKVDIKARPPQGA